MNAYELEGWRSSTPGNLCKAAARHQAAAARRDRAKELILLGDVIDATETLRIGLANQVPADLELESAALAARLAAQLPLAVSVARRGIDAHCSLEADSGFRAAAEEQVRCLTSEDFKEPAGRSTRSRSPTGEDAEGDSS
jgi:enoyl-CoA hydratase/carnithine racemase